LLFNDGTSVPEALPAATETVAFARQRPDGDWKAIGYLIRPAGDGAQEPEPRDQQVSQ
jgi:hypothetical protein